MISWPELANLAQRARDLDALRRANVINHDQQSELLAELQREARRQTVPAILFHVSCGPEAMTVPLPGTLAVVELLSRLLPLSDGCDSAEVERWVSKMRDCRFVGRIGVFACTHGNLVLVSDDRLPDSEE